MRVLADFDWAGRAALLRADLNVPLANGRIADDARIEASLTSIRTLLAAGAGVLVLSHFGRPREGAPEAAFSLAPVAGRLSELLALPVVFLPTLTHGRRPAAGEVMLLENTRFNTGEKENSAKLAQAYARLGDTFVMDAFASAHRAEASTVALASAASQGCCAGQLLAAELASLERALAAPARPLVAVIGGAKISTKLPLLDRLASLADTVITGGGIANTLLAASGTKVGRSLDEPSCHEDCRRLLARHADKFLLPNDVVVATNIAATSATTVAATSVADDAMILDVGTATCARLTAVIATAGTIIWNGALGMFENPVFAGGTRALAQAITASAAFSLAGGGETVACLRQFGLADKLGYLSTGGGAFLEFVEGRELPAVAALN